MKGKEEVLKEFLNEVEAASKYKDDEGFKEAGLRIENFIEKTDRQGVIELVKIIGTIPESISPSSSEEKVFAKSGDIISAHALKLLGLQTQTLDARGGAGDVIAKSKIYDYSLIGDAKSFRLSRTAKKSKGF